MKTMYTTQNTMHYNFFLTDNYLTLLNHLCRYCSKLTTVLQLTSSTFKYPVGFFIHPVTHLLTSLTPVIRLEKVVQNFVIKNTLVTKFILQNYMLLMNNKNIV